ncbi:MAG TPA: polysaccharide biosynthesis tyrosine autokinase [Rhizomicrobium sp.]|nr:polysaccharide biosynthesis tyrosine autokinase [Rhizomicrobium sp.]
MSAASTTVPVEAAPAFRMGDLVRVARSRRAVIRNVALAVVAATFAVLMLLPTMWSTSASVMIDPRKNNVTDVSSVLSQLPTDPSSLQNQIQILTSRDLAAHVIGKLRLYNDPEFNTSLKPGALSAFFSAIDPRNWVRAAGAPDLRTERDKIVDTFSKHLAVAAEGLSTTLTVTFASRDPAKAALIANTVVDTYIEDQIASKRAIGDKTTDWLVNRTHELAQQLQADEAAVQRYKADNNLNETADGTSFADQQITAISNQLVLAKADLAEKQATNDRVQALVRSGDTADVSQILASPLIVQLRTQQGALIAQESDLSAKYGPRHPKMIAMQQQKRDLQDKIATEVNRLAGSISNDVVVARAQVGSLQASLAQAEKQAGSQNLVRVKLRALQSNAQSTRTMYEAFVGRLRETQDQDVATTADARVISHAPVPSAPSSPKRALILGASIPAGLMLGLLAALLLERFSGPVPVRAVQPAAGFRAKPRPVLPAPPVLVALDGAFDPRAGDAVIDWPASAFAQNIAALLQQLRRAKRGAGAAVVTVTSPDAGIAKTSVAVALARVASRSNLRVAVIDTDLHRPLASRAMKLGPRRTGLIELLTGTAALAHAFARDPRSNALVISPARPPRDPAAVLASPKMAALTAHLRRRCDLVIFCGPTMFADDEVRALAAMSDALLVVTREESVERSAYAVESLRGKAAAGLVLVR